MKTPVSTGARQNPFAGHSKKKGPVLLIETGPFFNAGKADLRSALPAGTSRQTATLSVFWQFESLDGDLKGSFLSGE